jgi:hypothetical protein
MKRHHAAALALISWYLMVPPAKSTGEPDLRAPLSKWVTDGSYDTVQACHKRYQDDVQRALTFAHKIGHDVSSRIQNEKCIASNDPRLAK